MLLCLNEQNYLLKWHFLQDCLSLLFLRWLPCTLAVLCTLLWLVCRKCFLSLFSPSLLVGWDIVFRFIIEYSSRLRDFGPLGNNTRSIFYMRIFEKTILLLVLKLENSYRVIIS